MNTTKVSFAALFLTALCALLYLYKRYRLPPSLKVTVNHDVRSMDMVEYYNGLPRRLAANYYPQKVTHNDVLIEPNVATEALGKINVAFLVKSGVRNFQRRKVIRGTWGSVKIFQNTNLFVVFIVGIDLEHKIRLEGEARKFKDIVQVNVSDKLSNQPKKMLTAFHWIINSLEFNPDFVVTTEDTCVVNIPGTLKFLLAHQEDVRNSIYCGFMFENNTGVIRGHGPRSVSKNLYPEEIYPPFCRGQFVLLSSPYIEKLYLASTVTNITGFHLEDVLLFGILREKLGIENSITNIINGGTPLVYYPWDETEKAVHKMLMKWEQWKRYLNAISSSK